MKILIISYFFPPFNVIGAVRVSKLAEYWLSKGHDVVVISAESQPLPRDLKSRFPKERVIYTKWFNINAAAEKFIGGRPVVALHGFDTKISFFRFLGATYKNIFNIPDAQIGWYPYAISAAECLFSDGWVPNLIYASALPITSHCVAKKLASKFSIPWLAEFRDLWTDSHNYKAPFWRRYLDLLIEKSLLQSASAFVTVSSPLAKSLAKKTKKPVGVVMNGFDPDDYLSNQIHNFPSDKLNIIYTGMIYVDKQEISIFLEGLRDCGSRDKIQVHFYGRYLNVVSSLAKKLQISNLVNVYRPVSYEKSIAIQKSSDVLLFLTWNDKNNTGVLTGKIFEYFGSRHPILVVGSQIGQAGQMVLDRNSGFVAQNSKEISQQLEYWVDQKLNNKKSFELPKSINSGLTRREQFETLDKFLIENDLMPIQT